MCVYVCEIDRYGKMEIIVAIVHTEYTHSESLFTVA